MKNTYTTSQVAQIIGIHPNTVRLYEELQLITPPERKANGYRIFTDLHIRQSPGWPSGLKSFRTACESRQWISSKQPRSAILQKPSG